MEVELSEGGKFCQIFAAFSENLNFMNAAKIYSKLIFTPIVLLLPFLLKSFLSLIILMIVRA